MSEALYLLDCYLKEWTATVTSIDGSFDSGDLAVNTGTFTHKFNTPGTFSYYCKYHGTVAGAGMFGQVIVE